MTNKAAGPFKAVKFDQGGSLLNGARVVDATGETFCWVRATDCVGGDLMAAKARATRIAEALDRADLRGASADPNAGRDEMGEDSINPGRLLRVEAAEMLKVSRLANADAKESIEANDQDCAMVDLLAAMVLSRLAQAKFAAADKIKEDRS